MRKSFVMLLLFAMLSVAFGSVASADTQVTSSISGGPYNPGSTITVTGTSDARKDIFTNLVYNGDVKWTGTIRADQNTSGTFFFNIGLPEGLTGSYTILVGYGTNVVIKNITVVANGGGGSTPTTPPPPPVFIPNTTTGAITETNVDKVTDDAAGKLQNALSDPAGTDQTIAKAASEAADTLKQVLKTLPSVKDQTKAKETLAKVLGALDQLASSSEKMKDPSQALLVVQALIETAGTANQQNGLLSNDSLNKVMQTVSTSVNSLTEKAGRVDGSALKATKENGENSVAVDELILTKIVQVAIDTNTKVNDLLKQSGLTDGVQKPTLQISIDAANAPGGVKENEAYSIIIPKQPFDLVQDNKVNLNAKLGAVQFQLAPGSLPVSKNDTYSSVVLRVKPPANSTELLNNIPSDSTSFGGPIKEMDMMLRKSGVSDQTMNNQLNGSIQLSFSLNGVDMSKLNPDRVVPNYYNETTGKWEIVRGGKYNPKTNSVDFNVEHLSIYTLLEVNKMFTDTKGRWSETYVSDAYAKGIVSGRTEDLFDPTAEVTRAEFATMLVQSLGVSSTKKSSFSDVDADAWYSSFVAAANANGLIDGMDGTHFAPDEKITREQMATMIGRALTKVKGAQQLIAADQQKTLAVFSDKSLISAYATAYIALSVQAGLMNGTTDTTVSPDGAATREQAAKMMVLLFNK